MLCFLEALIKFVKELYIFYRPIDRRRTDRRRTDRRTDRPTTDRPKDDEPTDNGPNDDVPTDDSPIHQTNERFYMHKCEQKRKRREKRKYKPFKPGNLRHGLRFITPRILSCRHASAFILHSLSYVFLLLAHTLL